MSVTKIDFEAKEKAIELPNGTVLDLPQRTKDINDKLYDLEKKRQQLNEYDFLCESLTVIFGKDGFKKIAPSGNKENLDYLSKVYLVSVDLILEDKVEAERERMERCSDQLETVAEKVKAINPLLDKVK